MNFFKKLIIVLSIVFLGTSVFADTHSPKEKIITSNSEDVPLNNPFSSSSGSSAVIKNSTNLDPDLGNISDQQILANYKLVGVLMGKKKQFASFSDTAGNFTHLAIKDSLANKLQLVWVEKNEIRFLNSEGKIISLDFKNIIKVLK